MRPGESDKGIVTRVDSMDAEHRLQASLVSELEEILRQGQDLAAADRILAELVDFSSVHFHSEELMMRLYSYPHLDPHAAAHAKLLAQVRAIKERYDRDGAAQALEVVAELRSWLVDHIKSLDQTFAVWLAKNGIRPQ